MRKRLLTITVLALGLAAQAEQRPNILFIFLDDFGWRDTGYMGSDFYETPNIDRLAKGGMVFTDAYSCSANCAPARACLLSGQYTPRHEIFNVGTKPRGLAKHRRLEHIAGTRTLRPDIITWAESLQQAGYRTGMFGKWHLGTTPGEQGFDVEVDHTKLPGFRGHFGPNRQYLADVLTDKTIEFIEGSKTKPWCAYLSHYAVHTPIQAKPELTAKYEQKTPTDKQTNAKYAAMIESMDDSVGTVLDTLDRLKLADNTIVIFYADNGGHGGVTSNAPLRGSKGMLYEGGIRVPMAVRWPGVVKSGTTSDEPVIGIDLYPTLLEATQTKLPPRVKLDGTSLLPLFSDAGASLFRPAIYWHFPAYLQGYTKRHGPFRTTPAGAIRMGDWKLIEYLEDGALELYNLADDIGEEQNLTKREAKRTAEMHSIMKAWRRATNAPVPTEMNPEFDPAAYKAAFNRR